MNMDARSNNLDSDNTPYPYRLPANVHFPDTSKSHYRPLNKERKEIRLLTVEPGKGTEPLQCWLRHTCIDPDALLHFETISYCWGDSKRRGWICVNGTIISVPASSANAIRRMRLPDRPRVLWIDALCINQDDVQEKGWQVAFMSYVYRTARTNLIYLGEDEEREAENVVRILRKFMASLRTRIRELDEDERERWLVRSSVPESWRDNPPLSNEVLEAFHPLFSLTWFRRLWVLQEAGLAFYNICSWGSTTFPLEDVLAISYLAISHPGLHLPSVYPEPSSLLGLIASSLFDFTKCSSLDLESEWFWPEDVWILGQRRLASDPRDYIYAILAILQFKTQLNTIPALLAPDYTKPVGQVFRDATRYMLGQQSLGRCSPGKTLLGNVYHRDEGDMATDGATSWTVKWGYKSNDEFNSVSFSSITYHSSEFEVDPGQVDSRWKRCRILSIRDSVDPDILTLKGITVGTVSLSTSLNPTRALVDLDSTNVSDSLAVLSLLEFLYRACVQYSRHSSPLDIDLGYKIAAELMTAGGNTHWRRSFITKHSKASLLQDLMHYIRCTRTSPPEYSDLNEHDTDDLTRDITAFYSQFRLVANSRCFFVTGNEKLGIGSRLVKQNDVLAVFEGERHPLVLRPCGKEYRLVGAAYVYGLMSGEAYTMGLDSTWFDLR